MQRCACCRPSSVYAQEPQTRAEALAREREEKSKQLEPPQPGRLERALLTLENGRFFERILNPAEGFYPKIGNITPGSGFAIGPGYRMPPLLGEDVQFSAFGQVSVQRLLDARFAADDARPGRRPSLRGRARAPVRLSGGGLLRSRPRSLREDHTTYGLRSTDVGGTAGVRVTPWLSFGSGLELMTPRVAGLPDQPDFLRSEVSAEVNTRQPRGNPRQGARYALAFQHFEALDGCAP